MSNGDHWLDSLGNIVKALELGRRIKELLWPTVAGAAMALIGWLVGLRHSINPFYILIGTGVLVVCTVWVLVGFRALFSRTGGRRTGPEDTSLGIIGNAPDGRSYARVRDRIVEFDGVAANYFRGLSDTEVSTLARRLSATERYLFSEWDLRHLLSWGTLAEERPFVDVHRRYFENRWVAKFWSRQEFGSLSESERERHVKPDVALRAWAEGTALPMVHNLGTEWLTQGAIIMADRLRHQHGDHPRAEEFKALAPFDEPQYVLDAIPSWIASALDFAKKWPQQEGRPLTR